MGDDGEKFGAWPTTWDHCWGEGRWVDRFFEALEANADWLTTTTPTDWLATHRRSVASTSRPGRTPRWANGRCRRTRAGSSPRSSTTPQAKGRPEARWLRGGFWRNFQVRYREINDLHKQMLRTSDKVAAMPAGPDRALATDQLYKGQSNDCYWHGLFGGIYIGHMRLATCEHLIAAEDLADTAAGTLHTVERLDLDLDGLDDVRLATAGPGRLGRPDGGRRDRRLGHPARPPRPVRGPPPPPEAYHADAARAGRRDGRDGDATDLAAGRPRSTSAWR